MTQPLFLCHPRCSTCAKARAWMGEHGIDHTERDIRIDNPTVAELTLWHTVSGLPIRRFFNTSGRLYRSMGLKDKLPSMSDEEAIALLATDGMLVKRPLLVIPDGAGDPVTVLVGFRQNEWEAALL
ncbi:arsenate reductase family protein [Bifidobacterium callimiconis]|uniref:ArsC family transcriptional regulator n=1 Tax=Bifidobacterium callimiconis TaxID=2306973 RepID=A0A430FCU3_9BIFI|nr:arsenate reductase family protein [Bifidobacterium callimiconis]RSX50659.1 ArsC family transcriptional regulator [Bifidobacterium callimiconis]